ncbi:ALKBH8 [Cordylochernes scorpioides]|uniref:ALKBH8 n=1 Tax=Cordylochernes scorpioides TaxID=51811 RepID=A0ABY6LBB8_9ARAC|nr:ALKBH8 [Cordylochernes scorpioides]
MQTASNDVPDVLDWMVETRSGKMQDPAQERIKAEESAKPQPGATIGRDASSDPVVLNPNIDIPKYDGTEEPRPWIESLEEIGFLYHWADYIISRYAAMNMIGSAKTWLNLHKVSFTSWENFKSRLIEDFASDANKEEMRMRLNRIQQWNEPAIRFAEDILVLCNKVDPQMEEETKINWVIGGLKKEYSFALHLNPPKNTNELLEICKKLDLFEKNYQERAEKSKALYNGPRSPRPHHQEQWKNATSFRRPYQNTSKPQAPAPRYYQNTSKPQAPTPRYYQNKPLPQVSAPRRSYTPNPEPKPVYPSKTYNKNSNRNRTEDGRPICFKCNKPGHVARYCRVRFVRIVEEDPIVTQDKVEEEIRMDNGTQKSRPLLYSDVSNSPTSKKKMGVSTRKIQILKCIFVNEIEELKSFLGMLSFYIPEVEDPFHSPSPPGLTLLQDFLSAEEEQQLLDILDWPSQPTDDGCGKTLRHRQVQHFGFEFEYGANRVDPNRPLEHRPIPPVCLTVLQRLVESGHVDRLSDQLTVNRYLPGQGIPPHIDSHSSCEEQLVSLSLSAQVVMDFRHATTGQQRSMVVPRRSVLIMSGDSRYIWTHGIAPRKSDVVPVTDHNGHQCLTLQRRDIRTSFTFRTLRQTPCRCKYPANCDSQLQKTPLLTADIKEGDAEVLEKTYVHKVYEDIASHFSETRHSPWPQVAQFLQSLPTGSVVLDAGCGNGKYLAAYGTSHLVMTGCDTSIGLLHICRNKGQDVVVADTTALPHRSGSVDACISIAVLHHLATQVSWSTTCF